MTFKLGLTGSIGMGKSTTANMFAEAGCAVWDADAAVHRLYAKGGAAVEPIEAAFPEAIENGAVSRGLLRKIIGQNSEALSLIEKIVHPLVAADRKDFLEKTASDICVLDIPLLFETGADKHMDAVVCVTVSPSIQRKRVLDRQNMNEELFEAILAKQLPDEEKRKRANYVIKTDTLEHARKQVHDITQEIRSRITHA